MSSLEIDLPALTDPLMKSIRVRYEHHYADRFGSDKKGLYREADWRRLEYASRLIPPGTRSILEVGVGPGPMLNYLTLSERFDQVVGIDIRKYSNFLALSSSLDFRLMSVDKLEFSDQSFDVVLCMEVLEHVPTATMLRGIAELRRVARSTLVMSVPFEEPLPLPSYHLQRFDMQRIREVFPLAELHMLHRPRRTGWPWALAVETPSHGLASGR